MNEQNTVHWPLSQKTQTSLFSFSKYRTPPTPHTHTHADIHIWKIFEEINFVTFSNFKKYIEKGV